MLKPHNAQYYWNQRSECFSSYYQEPSWFDQRFRQAIFVRLSVAIDVCRQLNASSVLDVGCGPGVTSAALVTDGGAEQVVGIDFAPAMIADARRLVASKGITENCRFIEGDFMTWQPEPGSFDLAVALGVLDYTPEPQAVIRKMSEAARQAVVVSWPENGLRMMLRRLRYTCPVFSYTENRIRELHRNAGIEALELVKTQGGWVSIGELADG